MVRQRSFTDEERAVGLACLTATKGNVKRAARLCGVSRSTLRGWRDRAGPTAQTAQALANERRRYLAAVLRYLATRLMRLSGRRMRRLNALQAVKAAGHAIDAVIALNQEADRQTQGLTDLKWDRLTESDQDELRRLLDKLIGRDSGEDDAGEATRGVSLVAAGLRVTYSATELGLNCTGTDADRDLLQSTVRRFISELDP